jgi:hypothetical protein
MAAVGGHARHHLEHDGLRTYYRFAAAWHQSRLPHQTLRYRELVETLSPQATRLSLGVMGVLGKALAVRDRCQR